MNLLDEYGNGKIQGTLQDAEAEEKLDSRLPLVSYGEVLDEYGLWRGERDSDGLYLPFLACVRAESQRLGISGTIEQLSQDSRINPWPESQTCGDCVSHFTRNAADIARATDIYALREPEAWHFRSSTEQIYGWRVHAGRDGASCARLVGYVNDSGGLLLRKRYDELGLDLSEYKASIGIKWGRNGTPDSVNEVASKHQVINVTRCTDRDQLRQAYRNGLAVGGCSNIAYSRTRNEDGVSRVTGSWAHAMAGIGYDERGVTKKKYGEPLVCEVKSWGSWNSGGRKILGTDIWIPKGSCWVKESDYVKRKISRGGCYVMAGVGGWELDRLDSLGFGPLG